MRFGIWSLDSKPGHTKYNRFNKRRSAREDKELLAVAPDLGGSHMPSSISNVVIVVELRVRDDAIASESTTLCDVWEGLEEKIIGNRPGMVLFG